MLSARRVLAGWLLPDDVSIPAGDRTQQLIDAGSHPDSKKLERLPKDEKKPDQGLSRSITVAQVSALEHILGVKPPYSGRRVVGIDSADDLERNGANALLKNLEETPAGTVFLLVSHSPGRVLPTIRSRCRLLRFEALGDDIMTSILRERLPKADDAEIAALVRAGEGSPGRALGYAGLALGALDAALAA